MLNQNGSVALACTIGALDPERSTAVRFLFVDRLTKLYNQGTMTFYAHENVENLGVYIFSCSFTRALICGKIIINDVVSVQPQKEIEMKTTDINKVRYTNRWRIVYGICNN